MQPDDYETALPETFDPETQEGTTFNVVPIGTYVAQIADASVYQPKTGDGYQVALTWQITEGEHEGRYVWQRITFLHSKAQAVAIGRQQFKDLCIATGVSEQVTDVSVFKFIPCRIKVGIEVDKQGIYADKNRVSRVLPREEPPKTDQVAKPRPPAPASKAAQPAAKPTAGNSGAPWRKPKPPLGEEIDDAIPH
jgi:hypothetical protein